MFSGSNMTIDVNKLISLPQVNQKAENQLARARRGSQRATSQNLNTFISHKPNGVATNIICIAFKSDVSKKN